MNKTENIENKNTQFNSFKLKAANNQTVLKIIGISNIILTFALYATMYFFNPFLTLAVQISLGGAGVAMGASGSAILIFLRVIQRKPAQSEPLSSKQIANDFLEAARNRPLEPINKRPSFGFDSPRGVRVTFSPYGGLGLQDEFQKLSPQAQKDLIRAYTGSSPKAP